MYLVSACLAGICSTYCRQHRLCEPLAELVRSHRAVPACPEQLGGLATPRPAAEIQGGATGGDVLDGKARVVNRLGEDVTSCFVFGAYETLKLAQLVRPELTILQERSPSCGAGFIYDGSFSGRLHPGMGVAAALLARHGFRVVAIQDWLAAAAQDGRP